MGGGKGFSVLRPTVAILLTSLIIVEAAGVTPETSIHDVLTKYGLPVGLMPDSAKNYTLSEDGHFVVELEKPCYVQFNYLVYYDRIIEGVLKYGEIADLSGVEAQEFFIWVHVTGIKVDLPSSKYIYFRVGPISKKIEISWFDSIPTCESRGKENCNEIQPALAKVVAWACPAP